MRLLSSVLDLFFPRLCPGCGQNLSKGEKELCIQCLANLPETGFHLKRENPVKQKFIGRFEFEQAIACYFFQKSSAIQHIIHHFKYQNKKDTALFMGRQMGRLLQASPVFQKPEGIVPVPLHPLRQKRRGYNQSALLGEGIAQILNIPLFSHMLKRTSRTQTQTKLNGIQRWQNVKDAFSLGKKELPRLHHLLLVDDVITSGATLEACARTLSKREGSKVSMIALATADHL